MKFITIEQAITACDELKPNSYSTEQKKKWLNEIDGLVWDEILLTHENCPRFFNVTLNGDVYYRVPGFDTLPDDTEYSDKAVVDDKFYIWNTSTSEWDYKANAVIVECGFRDYDDNDEGDTKLLVCTPYDSIYTYYLHMQIDKANNDKRYENSAQNFANAYNSFANWYNRHFMPVQKQQWFRFLRR